MPAPTKKSQAAAPQKKYYFLQVQNFTEELGTRISMARRKLNLKQTEMAQKSQTSIATYKRIEAGDMNVSLGTILSVLYCLDQLESCEGILSHVYDEGFNPDPKKKLPQRIRSATSKISLTAQSPKNDNAS